MSGDTPSTPSGQRQAWESGRSLLRTYREERRRLSATTDSPSVGSARVDARARELEELCEMAQSITQRLEAARGDSAVVELARALASASAKRDATVADLDAENRHLAAENALLRGQVFDLERQLEQTAACFDSLLVCLDHESVARRDAEADDDATAAVTDDGSHEGSSTGGRRRSNTADTTPLGLKSAADDETLRRTSPTFLHQSRRRSSSGDSTTDD